MANIDKFNPSTMVEDMSKRSENKKKFVTEWVDNQRTAVFRTYNEAVHDKANDRALYNIEKANINNVEFEDVEVTEYLNRF